MTAPQLNQLDYAEEETGKPRVEKRTFGERSFNYIKYIFFGFLMNIGVSYVIGRDALIFKAKHDKRQHPDQFESYDPSILHKETYLPDFFHQINQGIADFLRPRFEKMFAAMPDSLRTHKIDPSLSENDRQIAIKEDSAKLAIEANRAIINAILLTWGGLASAFSMQAMDRHKLKVVKTLDRCRDWVRFHFGGGLTVSDKENYRRKAAYHRIATEPSHQDSASRILLTRGLGIGTAVLSSFGSSFIDPTREGLGRLETAFFDQVNILEKKISKNIRPGFTFWFSDGKPGATSLTERLFILGVMETIVGGYTAVADFQRHQKELKKIQEEDALSKILQFPQQHPLALSKAGSFTDRYTAERRLSELQTTALGGM